MSQTRILCNVCGFPQCYCACDHSTTEPHDPTMSETPTEPKHYFRCKACNPSLACWDTGARCKHPEAIEHAPLPSTPAPEASEEKARTMVPTNYPWLETAHFLPDSTETMLLAWVRGDHVTYRTGRYLGGKFVGTSRDEFRTQPNYYREVTGLFNLPDEGDKLRAENAALTSKLAEVTKELSEARLSPVAMKLAEAQVGAHELGLKLAAKNLEADGLRKGLEEMTFLATNEGWNTTLFMEPFGAAVRSARAALSPAPK